MAIYFDFVVCVYICFAYNYVHAFAYVCISYAFSLYFIVFFYYNLYISVFFVDRKMLRVGTWESG